MAKPPLRLVHGYKPHAAVILALDPATKSGWAIFSRGRLLGSGVARDASDRFEVLEAAAEIGADEELPVIVVAETWSCGNWKSWDAIAGVHQAWGRWAEQLELGGFDAVVRVLVDTWRHDIFGTRAKLPRKVAKELAKTRVKSMYGKKASADEAEAILIGEWGCRAGEVGALLAA